MALALNKYNVWNGDIDLLFRHESATTQEYKYQMITLSDNAADEVRRLLKLEKKDGWGLRVGVVGGGCSGLSYTLAFEEEPKKADTVEQINGIQVYIDPKSYLFLNGITLDYSTDLLNGGFKFINPNATRTCSCGSSFSA